MDTTDARLLLALTENPRASALTLAEQLGISRNTVQARLARLDATGVLRAVDLHLDPAALGYPVTACITMRLRQRRLDDVAAELAEVAEVTEVLGISGEVDLLVRVAGQLLAIDGVERTTTALVMRTLVGHRLTPLLERIARSPSRPGVDSQARTRGPLTAPGRPSR